MTRGCVSSPVYLPKDGGACCSEAIQLHADVPKPDRTLNRWRLGTLKTSQRNCRSWLSHGIFQRLLKAISKPAYPSPLTTFREPAWPGKGCWKSLKAATGSAKTLTEPLVGSR